MTPRARYRVPQLLNDPAGFKSWFDPSEYSLRDGEIQTARSAMR